MYPHQSLIPAPKPQAIDPSFHPPEIFKDRREAVRFLEMVIFWHYRFMITHVASMAPMDVCKSERD